MSFFQASWADLGVNAYDRFLQPELMLNSFKLNLIELCNFSICRLKSLELSNSKCFSGFRDEPQPDLPAGQELRQPAADGDRAVNIFKQEFIIDSMTSNNWPWNIDGEWTIFKHILETHLSHWQLTKQQLSLTTTHWSSSYSAYHIAKSPFFEPTKQ